MSDPGVVEQEQEAVDGFAQVVRRNVGGHSDRDSRSPVQQEVGDAGRQDDRFAHRFVVVGLELDGVLVDVGQQLFGQPGHAHLGVPHGRRRVSVDRAEIALSVHQWLPHGEFLGEPHDRVVNGRLSVGMVLADDVADDPSRFLVGFVVDIPQLLHGKKHPAMNRFQAVPHVRQRPSDDHGHGVVQVRGLHFLFDIDGEFSWVILHGFGRNQMSRFFTLRALSSIKRRRGSTWSPIRMVKISSVSIASSMLTRSSTRVSGFMVVSHN